MRPTEPWNRTSPEKTTDSSGIENVTCPGLWPGVKSTSISKPGHLQRLAAGKGVLGVPALVRAESGPWDEGHDVREHELLDLRHPDLGAGGLRDRRDRADVVEMGVGQQDALEIDAERLDRIEQALGLLARIDDQGLVEPSLRNR